MEISKKELLDKYGIDLSKGQYTIENINGTYKINTLRDDTSGCILVGSAIKGDRLLHSRGTWENLMIWLKQYISRENIWITVKNIPVVESIPKPEANISIKPVEVIKPVIIPVDTTPIIQPIETPTISVTQPIPTNSWITKLIKFIIKLFKKNE